MREFARLLGAPEREMQLLFMKIDVNSDGKVSWNEFSSFVLDVHSHEGSIAAGDSVFDGTVSTEQDDSFHHETSVAFVAVVERVGLLITVTSEGVMRSWFSGNGHAVGKPLAKTVQAVPPRSSVTAVTVLRSLPMVAVGADDFKIRLLDAQSLRHELTYDCMGRWPLAMDSFLLSSDTERAGEAAAGMEAILGEGDSREGQRGKEGWLVWGDDAGELHFVPEVQILQFRATHEVVPIFRSSLQGLWDIKVFAPAEPSGQSVWVSTVGFVPDVGLTGVVVAGATNGHSAVVSPEQRCIFHFCFHHRLALKALAWCGRQNNLLASAGLDRTINLWRPDPMVGGKAQISGSLNGHKTGVADLCFHAARDVLFSLDSQGTILAWDLASRTLVSRLAALSSNVFDIQRRVMRMTVNQSTRHLVTATNHVRLQGVRALDLRDESEKLVPHVGEVAVLLYNKAFDFILSADRSGFVSTWATATGAQLFKFVCVEKDTTLGMPQVECGGFDVSERRLVIGWSQGAVQVYNFSNGTLLHNLLTDAVGPVAAVGQVAYARGQEVQVNFFAALADGSVAIWPNRLAVRDARALRTMVVPDWLGGEDYVEVPLTCAAMGHCRWGVPDVLCTGRRDGSLLVWDMQTGFLRKQDMLIQVGEGAGEAASLLAIAFMHRLAHIALLSDAGGNIHVVDVEVGVKVGVIRGARPGVQYTEVSALAVDFTDSFLFAGYHDGFMQVWDLSQVFSAEEEFNAALCIDVFYWRQHHAPCSGIVHIAHQNLLATAGLDAHTACQLTSITGKRIGRFGHDSWTTEDIAAAVLRGEAQLSDGARENRRLGKVHVTKAAVVGTTGYIRRLRARKEKEQEDGAEDRNDQGDGASEAEAENEDSDEEKSSADVRAEQEQRGQVAIKVVALLLPRDRSSRADVVVRIKLEGSPARNCRSGQTSLFFVDSTANLTVQLTVLEADTAGDEVLLGQREELLADLATGADTCLQLQRRDGGATARLRSLTLHCTFLPVQSELPVRRQKSSAATFAQQVRGIVARQGHTMAPQPCLAEKAERDPEDRAGAGGNGSKSGCEDSGRFGGATRTAAMHPAALATPRWLTRDHRFLSVYHLQPAARGLDLALAGTYGPAGLSGATDAGRALGSVGQGAAEASAAPVGGGAAQEAHRRAAAGRVGASHVRGAGTYPAHVRGFPAAHHRFARDTFSGGRSPEKPAAARLEGSRRPWRGLTRRGGRQAGTNAGRCLSRAVRGGGARNG
mgnify:CR=1 FL=1